MVLVGLIKSKFPATSSAYSFAYAMVCSALVTLPWLLNSLAFLLSQMFHIQMVFQLNHSLKGLSLMDFQVMSQLSELIEDESKEAMVLLYKAMLFQKVIALGT